MDKDDQPLDDKSGIYYDPSQSCPGSISDCRTVMTDSSIFGTHFIKFKVTAEGGNFAYSSNIKISVICSYKVII
jgi:hypothetical protein